MAPQVVNANEDFYRSFQNEIAEIQAQIERLSDSSITPTDRSDISSLCLAKISTLANRLSDASSELPSYDQRMYNDHLRLLQEKLNQAQSSLAPKPKFSFKSKRPQTASTLDPAAYLAQRTLIDHGAATPSSIGSHDTSRSGTPVHLQIDDHLLSENAPVPTQPAPLLERLRREHAISLSTQAVAETEPPTSDRPDQARPSMTLQPQTGAYVPLPPTAVQYSDPCLLSNFDRCFVDLTSVSASAKTFASLSLTDCKSSLLVCGSIAGPAHITKVQNSVIVLDCRQFRMHDCDNVDVYLYCSSRPIIENCKSIRFTAMPNYLQQLLINKSAALPLQRSNMFDQVDDFKWLKAEQSPNWQILTPHHSVTEWTWKSVLPAKMDVDVAQTLRDVKIKV